MNKYKDLPPVKKQLSPSQQIAIGMAIGAGMVVWVILGILLMWGGAQ